MSCCADCIHLDVRRTLKPRILFCQTEALSKGPDQICCHQNYLLVRMFIIICQLLCSKKERLIGARDRMSHFGNERRSNLDKETPGKAAPFGDKNIDLSVERTLRWSQSTLGIRQLLSARLKVFNSSFSLSNLALFSISS